MHAFGGAKVCESRRVQFYVDACVRVHTCVFEYTLYMCLSVCVCVSMCVCMWTCFVCLSIDAPEHVSDCVYVSKYDMHACIYVFECACQCMYVPECALSAHMCVHMCLHVRLSGNSANTPLPIPLLSSTMCSLPTPIFTCVCCSTSKM